ncbi:DUF4230 domain-containing protein [Moraxella sp. FZFQ2102]|uniref:DUF4230 domain-containing protein n=1 Tax=Moraxella sp. FZFQ2102 TaxID=2953752 RepID=UPI00209C6404|nr:DUF4230 domain-containing protein [Moraxella sp. FZFQ2102]USZ14340.1 DUF4230 domain-containing protein [Moraxella sp. FZFQ2102]
MQIPQSKQTGNALVYVLLILVMVAILAMAGFWLVNKSDNYISTITKDGIITEIQTLSRLQTVAYSVDTIVTADKAGTWQNLWQDKQKGLFIIKGRVLAGVDLSGISAEMVQLSQTKNDKGETVDVVHITLPPSQVFEVFLDDIEVYDWQTGLFGTVAGDPKLFAQVQTDAKAEVLAKACQGDVLNLAMTSAAEQIKSLFMLTGSVVEVSTQGTGACKLATKTK